MISSELRRDKGILVLLPQGRLEADDFTALCIQVDSYLAEHCMLRGVFIRAKAFPGWKDFSAMIAHAKFLKDHIQRIEKVAVVADGVIANMVPGLANHFVRAQVQHFDYASADQAWHWLDQSD